MFTRTCTKREDQVMPSTERTRPPITSSLNAYAPTFQPTNHSSPAQPKLSQVKSSQPASSQPSQPSQPEAPQPALLSEFANYMNKKDLLRWSLVTFDDRPETYQSWKDSFEVLTQELNANPREELNLLIHYLGPDSRKHAVSIRTANLNNPQKALEKLWSRLDDRYGSPVLLESSIKSRLSEFPKLTGKDSKKLFELADLLSEVQLRMEDPTLNRSLAYLDSSTGMRPIVAKLPINLQEKWTTRATNYNLQNGVTYPPFTYLVQFVTEMSRIRNDPSFNYQATCETSTNCSNRSNFVNDFRHRDSFKKNNVQVKKTAVNTSQEDSNINMGNNCFLHVSRHKLNQCKTFQKLTLNERKKLLKDYNFCFKCCDSTTHTYTGCSAFVKCDICGNRNHPAALHVSDMSTKRPGVTRRSHYGGEESNKSDSTPRSHYDGEESRTNLSSCCTELCGKDFTGRSCSKTILVRVYPVNQPEKSLSVYALIDDQSTHTLARTELFDALDIPMSSVTTYSLKSCAGTFQRSGRQASGLVVESNNGSCRLLLPRVTECEQIPEEESEIPTPDIVKFHSHLSGVDIPPLNQKAQVLLLIGRDLPEAHHIEDQRTGPRGTPFAQKLALGWVLIGNVCLGNLHPPASVNVLKTTVHQSGRVSVFDKCEYNISLKLDDDPIFRRQANDNDLGQSIEDNQFIELMDKAFTKNSTGNWTAPLPFRETREILPNNRSMALKRALMLQGSLRRNTTKQEHFVSFMQGIFDSGHAEIAPPVQPGQECWYLPIFGVYHPKKKDKIRVVFDSSCKHDGISLNDVLMLGPDLMNRLDGVLMRFRKEPIAVIADIQQMFFCFRVAEPHRDYLRFFWHQNNDPAQELLEYRMCVHVFGNRPSPAVATYGLRRCVRDDCSEVVKQFVTRNFYVDDGLASFPSVSEAVNVLKQTQKTLLEGGNLKLHKIASNSEEVMQQFSTADLAKSMEQLDLDRDDLPIHHSLGLSWDLATDTFIYKASEELKPFTKRGLLSTVNGLFDPLGFIAPIILNGRFIMRQAFTGIESWDDPLPTTIMGAWKLWLEQLKRLDGVHIPRWLLSVSYQMCVHKTLHIFCDASEKAVSACAYLRGVTSEKISVGFVFGKCKVAPKSGHTIPRLELCAAVLAVELGEMLSRELDLPLEDIKYYSDSKVVLGYLSNERRRFYVYVCNRVSRIRKSSSPHQWNYVATEENPADQGTRGLLPEQLCDSLWLNGPDFLRGNLRNPNNEKFFLVDPDKDTEIRAEIVTLKTISSKSTLGISRFNRFGSWSSLVRAITLIKRRLSKKGNEISRLDSELLIIKETQKQFYQKEINALHAGRPLPRDSTILALSPYLDDGLLRVGGRINLCDLPVCEKTPILIPGQSHIARLLVRHHHEKIYHQGRHLTEGAIRSEGLWITGGKRLVSSIIHHCVTCRKMRGKPLNQKMADLPKDRLTKSPPFTFVGVDVFGPWTIITRRTRGGSAHSKRWAVLFTCLYSRAVHIEVIEEMTSSSFINAMRRFIAMRGAVSEFRSDRGTNFVGAASELNMNIVNVEDSRMRAFLEDKRIVWKFNPPHASHFGGSWERMIGIARRILDAMLMDTKHGKLTHEVLTTFMAEVMAIMNSRPLVPVSGDVEAPFILSPQMLLTQKTQEVPTEFKDLDVKDMYRSQWKMVQVMANTFWKRWKSEFLSTLQPRQKWLVSTDNLKEGDVVLLHDKESARTDWPVGVVNRIFPSNSDGLVRKIEVRILKDGKPCLYIRPATEVISLLTV